MEVLSKKNEYFIFYSYKHWHPCHSWSRNVSKQCSRKVYQPRSRNVCQPWSRNESHQCSRHVCQAFIDVCRPWSRNEGQQCSRNVSQACTSFHAWSIDVFRPRSRDNIFRPRSRDNIFRPRSRNVFLWARHDFFLDSLQFPLFIAQI